MNIVIDDDIDEETVKIFRNNFAGNFSRNLGIDLTNTAFLKESLLTFNSTEVAVSEALSLCPNTSSSPDGLSYKLLKAIGRSIISPLNIIFKHFFTTEYFQKFGNTRLYCLYIKAKAADQNLARTDRLVYTVALAKFSNALFINN